MLNYNNILIKDASTGSTMISNNLFHMCDIDRFIIAKMKKISNKNKQLLTKFILIELIKEECFEEEDILIKNHMKKKIR